MIFEFTNHTAKDMFANCRREDTFMNCMENTLSNHMENTFSNHMKNTFSNHTENTFANPMENTFTNNIENTFTYNIENSFAYPIENSFTYNIENSFAYPMENSFTYPMENSFINNMRNPFMNHTRDTFSNYLDNTYVTQINEDAEVDKGIEIDNVVNKAMRIDNIVDKGAKVDECMRMNEDVDNGTKVDTCAGADKEMSKNTEPFEVIQDEISCEIFFWDLLPDFLQAIFPSNYSYMIRRIIKLPAYYTNEGFEIQQFEVDLFVNVSTVEDIKTWFSTFERHSKTTMPQTKGYRVKGKRVIFRESRHCVHSQIVRKKQGDVRRKYPESARNRNTGCLATMCLWLERQRLTNSHPLEVNISFKHNYVINSAESLSFRRVHEEIYNKFMQMFHNGHSPASALYTHEDELHLSASSNESLVETLADRAINPDYTYVKHLFEHYRNAQLGEQNGISMFQRLAEEVSKYNESGYGRAILQEYNSRMGKVFILCIVTGLMSRVHEKIREAGEICYVDASASFEPLNTSITLLYTSCIAGALPLGLFITSDELEITIKEAINILKLILPQHAFFGRGCDVGPQNFLTDDSAAERNALKFCWPQSNLLLCTFHVLQAFWRWLYNAKHSISKELRIIIMNQMKKILYARTENDINNYYQELQDKFFQQYPLLANHCKHLWNRRQHWAHCFRLNLLLRGNHTNNYIEHGFGLLKDIIFARTKAYNSVQVFHFVIKNMERFYKRRLYGFVHRHPGHMEIANRFLCPSWETVDKDSIRQLANTDKYLVPSTKKESGLVYNVNSTIGTCNCYTGMTGAPCKHQGAVAMKYHIRIINFLPLLTPNDRMTFSYIASGLNVKDCSFYASLRTKPVLINQNNTIAMNDNESGGSNAITIAESKVGTDNEFSELEVQETDFDGLSFKNFLQEIEDDYMNCGPQLRMAFDKFAEQYKAAK